MERLERPKQFISYRKPEHTSSARARSGGHGALANPVSSGSSSNALTKIYSVIFWTCRVPETVALVAVAGAGIACAVLCFHHDNNNNFPIIPIIPTPPVAETCVIRRRPRNGRAFSVLLQSRCCFRFVAFTRSIGDAVFPISGRCAGTRRLRCPQTRP